MTIMRSRKARFFGVRLNRKAATNKGAMTPGARSKIFDGYSPEKVSITIAKPGTSAIQPSRIMESCFPLAGIYSRKRQVMKGLKPVRTFKFVQEDLSKIGWSPSILGRSVGMTFAPSPPSAASRGIP